MLEHLCQECDQHFKQVQQYLQQAQVQFSLNPRMVRGLDYYTRTTFEFVTSQLGAQSAVAAGGRYDGLVEQLGGPVTPGIGFALGLERVALLLEGSQQEKQPDLFIATMGEQARLAAFSLMSSLQDKGFWVEVDTEGRSFKSQMRRADKLRVCYSLVLGDAELESGSVQIKKMADGSQQQVALGLEAVSSALSGGAKP